MNLLETIKIVQAELGVEQGQAFERIFFQSDDTVYQLKAKFMEMYGEMGPSGGTGHSLNHISGLGTKPQHTQHNNSAHNNNEEMNS